MSVGIIEVITLLLGLSGFGLQPNPRAPSVDQSLQYAMPDADIVMHVDVASVVPGNFQVLKNLANQPAIKASPELAKMVRKTVGEIEGARGLAKVATGLDVVSDIHDATMFVRFVPRGEPALIATVHGAFTPALISKIGGMTKGKITTIGGGSMIEMGGNDPAVGVTRDGVLIAGTANLVRDRLADTWRMPARPAGSNLAYAAAVLGQKPVYAVVLSLSASARATATAELGGKNFLTEMILRHKVASFAMFHDGIGWTWTDRTRAGLESMRLMSEGMIDLLRAAQVAPRGFAKIALGGLEAYRGTDRRIDELLRRKGDLMKIVESYTGDGTFGARIDANPRTLELTVRATGKSLSEVVPTGLVLPLAVVGFTTMVATPATQKSVSGPRAIMAPPPAPRTKAAPPARKR